MSPIADRSIVVRIGANVTGLVNGLKTADQAAQDWGNKSLSYIKKNEQSLNTLSRGLGVVGAGLTGLAVLAVKSFADFDASMSSVQAATMETAANMDLLREAAIDAGARTVYSATEAAGAIEELAKAGVSTADILGGGLDGALDLAASGAIGVSEAAEIAATAMTQFGLGGEDVTHIADLLAAGAGKAQGGVGDLGMALKQAGLVADQTGLTIEETTAGLTAFASAGLIGSDAGTSFKSMLQRLTPQSLEAKNKMDELGISAYDAQGNFIGLSKFAQNLQDSLRNLTPEQRNSAMAVIFGSDAVRAANVLYEQGAKGIDNWTAAVNDQGYASEQAAIRMDNLKGDIEGLSGSTETALINMGEAADGPLRALVQGLDSAVDRFNGMSDGAQAATLWVVGGAGLLTLGLAGAMKLTTALGDTVGALKEMGVLSEVGAGRIGAIAGNAAKLAGVAAGVAAVGVAMGQIVDSLTDAKVATADELTQTLIDLGSTGHGILDLNKVIRDASVEIGALGQNVSDIANLGDAIERVYKKSSGDSFNDWIASAFGAETAGTRLEETFGNIDESLAGMIESGNKDQAIAAFQEIRDAMLDHGLTMDDVRAAYPQYSAALQDAVLNVESATPAQDAYNDALDTGGASAGQYADAMAEVIDQMTEATNLALAGRDAQRDYEAALDDAAAALEENGATLDITTEKGRENQAALDGIVSAGLALIDNSREQGASQGELQGIMQKTRDDFIRVAESMGMSTGEAQALADQLGLIPENVTPTVAINDQASGPLDDLWTKIQRLDGRTVTTNLVTKEQTVTTGVGNQVARASGGAIYGPGTGTSDSVPARLSNGEHVLTASDVTKLGGQGAVYSLRSAIQSGWKPQTFATGGEVSRQYVAPVIYQQSAGSSAPIGATSPSYFANASIYATDPGAVMKEIRSVVRQELAGRSFG